MIYTTKKEFIKAFQSKFGSDIEKFEEAADGSYYVYLKSGVDKGDFINVVIQYTRETIAFDDRLTFWVNKHGDEFGKKASCLPFNAYFDEDYDEIEKIDFGPFEINIVGENFMVHPQADGSFDIFRGETKLANLSPSIDEVTGGTVWETSDLISSEYVKQIGELIEEREM